jgi:DNA-binding PadR family transcriptional regulator
MTQEEWEEWRAGESERSRRLYELAKKGREELEAKRRAAEEQAARPQRRRRLFGFL